jgi:hypothetical protein
MTRASVFTIRNQRIDAVLVDSDGRRNDRGFERAVVAAGGQRRLFLKVETAAYIRPMLLDRSAAEWLAADTPAFSSYESLRAMIRLARANDIDLSFYISPVHARQLEIYRVLGLSDAMDSWERRLVEILDEDATSHAGRKPFPLWDFSGYNAVTEESVPALGDPVSRMRGYWETTHYTSRIGDLILNRLLGCAAEGTDRVPGFGVQLTRRNIESRLGESRAGGEQYRRHHPEDVKEIETAVAQVRRELSDRGAD